MNAAMKYNVQVSDLLRQIRQDVVVAKANNKTNVVSYIEPMHQQEVGEILSKEGFTVEPLALYEVNVAWNFSNEE